MHQHFDYSSLFNDAKLEEVGNSGKKFQNCERPDKNQIESHDIELNPSKDKTMHEGDNPLF
jgi:hypothetical protein